jgi:hypothetical protein
MRAHTFLPLVLAVVVGCGLVISAGCTQKGGGVTVSGKLILPSSLKLGENDSVIIGFIIPGDESAHPPAVSISKTDNSFLAKEFPPGKYRITVKLDTYGIGKDNTKRKAAFDKFNDTHDKKSSPLACEITSEPTQSFTIDADKGTVTKS